MPFNADQIRRVLRDNRIKKLNQNRRNFQVGEIVVIKNTPYPLSVPDGMKGTISEIRYNYFDPGDHLYVVDGLLCKNFRHNEISKENK